MRNTGHLEALELRLSHERVYLAKAKTSAERDLRVVWVSQIEKEIASERSYLGQREGSEISLSDDELLAELNS